MGNDAATAALTGMLPFIIFTGAIIAFPLSLLLLKRYKAAVLRTMAASGGATPATRRVPQENRTAGGAGPLEMVTIDGSSVPPASESGEALYTRATRAPWATVHAYVAGGVVYAACWLPPSYSPMSPFPCSDSSQ